MKLSERTRQSGILLHPTSLPTSYGIGDLGPAAYDFVDFLEQAGQQIWQVLPLTPTGFGDSPYQCFSAFACQPLLISPDHLHTLGLLTEEELLIHPEWDGRKVDYGSLIPWKNLVLRLAYRRFVPDEDYTAFVTENAHWLTDYALYMAIKENQEGKSWLLWEDEYKQVTDRKKKKWQDTFSEEILYHYFLQYIFFTEWNALHAYANEKGIRIIGDMPLFVALDSADVWANQGLFQLDSTGHPTVVAGVPPDYFSEDGQLWGNPLYDWKVHKKEDFKWWIGRIRHQLSLCDILRIDHFRGLQAYWEIPYGVESAKKGKWVLAPGAELFTEMKKQLGDDLPIIAEDLGIITPEVEALRDAFGFPGMKVLQFAFEGETESSYLPHQFTTTNCICYTGTHDNDTTRGWYENASEFSRDKVRRYMNTDGNVIHRDMIRACLGTIADYAIFPMQDVLGLGSDCRMNTPGVAGDNWSWRFLPWAITEDLAKDLRELTKLYGRVVDIIEGTDNASDASILIEEETGNTSDASEI